MADEHQEEPQDRIEAQPGGEGAWDRLNGKLAALDEQLAALEAAGRRNRNSKWVVTLLILIVLCGYGGLIYGTARNFSRDELVMELTSRSGRVLPHLSTHMTTVLKNVTPTYRAEIEAEAAKAWPIIMNKLPGEWETLQDNIEPKMRARMDVALQSVAKKQEGTLIKYFPELKDDEKREVVSKHLQEAVMIASAHLLHERLEKCADAILKVYDAINRFKPDDIRGRDRHMSDRMADVLDDFLANPTGARK